MNFTLIIIYGMLLLSMAAPFIALYAIRLVRKKYFKRHIQIQKRLFWTCVIGVIILELRIRFEGGSGSLVSHSEYVDTLFFKLILIAHIIGAVLTYIIWGIAILQAHKNLKMKKKLPGKYSKTHRRLGYGTVIGLFYTAITAFIVCIMAFFL